MTDEPIDDRDDAPEDTPENAGPSEADMINRLLADKQIAMSELARKANLRASQIHGVSSGHGRLTRGQVAAICRALDVPPTWFFPDV